MFRTDGSFDMKKAVALYDTAKKKLTEEEKDKNIAYIMKDVRAIGMEDIQKELEVELKNNNFELMNINVATDQDLQAWDKKLEDFDVPSKKK